MNTKDLKPIEGQAVIASGIAAIGLPFAASLFHRADWATFGFIITAAVLYLFQVYVFNLPDDYTEEDEKAVGRGAIAIIVLWAVSFALLIAGI